MFTLSRQWNHFFIVPLEKQRSGSQEFQQGTKIKSVHDFIGRSGYSVKSGVVFAQSVVFVRGLPSTAIHRNRIGANATTANFVLKM